MAEELNQHDSSQLASTVGTNDAGKPSEPVATDNMTPSQSSDYYNKTQQLAQQRREFEAERTRFEDERNRFNSQYPQQQNGYNPQGYTGYPNATYPNTSGYAAPQAGPVVPGMEYLQGQNPNNPHVYNNLVKELGFEAANSVLQSFNQLAAPFQQQMAQTNQVIQQIQIENLVSKIENKGKSLYGSEWDSKGNQAMDYVKKYGCSVEEAWAIVNAPTIKQAAIDQAYQNQQDKTQANVGHQQAAPSRAEPVINTFGDAFAAAVRAHS